MILLFNALEMSCFESIVRSRMTVPLVPTMIFYKKIDTNSSISNLFRMRNKLPSR